LNSGMIINKGQVLHCFPNCVYVYIFKHTYLFQTKSHLCRDVYEMYCIITVCS